MSLIQIILSRKEILFSLALVILVLLIALLLAVGPRLRRIWKREMKQRRMKRAMKLARLKEQRQRNLARQQPLVVAEAIAEEPLELVEELPAEPEDAGEPAEEEEPLDRAEAELAAMFEGVFEDEEVNQRYSTLLNGIEPISAEDLAALANKVADQLNVHEDSREDS